MTDSKAPVAAKRPAPAEAERVAIGAARTRVEARKPRVTVLFEQDADNKVDLQGAEHGDHAGWLARLQDAFGTRGTEFSVSQLSQLLTACRDEKGRVDRARVNAMLAMVEAAAPENELQAALAVQMAVCHYAMLTLMARAMRVDQIPQFETAGNMAVKLTRAFAQQAEVLAKLQRGGEQVVKVVHVHPGGKAVVGNVSTGAAKATGGGVFDENGSQPHAKALPAACGPPVMPPLRREDQERQPVPVARGEG